MSARNIECRCEPNRFTCGYCLRNAPPWDTTSYNPNLVDLRRYADPDDLVVLCGATFRRDPSDQHTETLCCALDQGHAGKHETWTGEIFPEAEEERGEQ